MAKPTKTFQRARKAEDKQTRRASILAVARAVVTERGYAEVAMADVAAQAGVAKGTLYLYFKSKEELVLALLGELLTAWLDEIDGALAHGRWSAATIAQLVSDGLERHRPLARLLAVLQTVLEHNIDFDAAFHFKTALLARMTANGALLERHLTRLRPGEGMRLVMHINALLIGLQQMADSSPMIARVLEEPSLRVLKVDFRHEFVEGLHALLESFPRHKR